MPEMPISAIKIGRRFRKDLGDIGALADSIQELGLLQPVVITPQKALVAGFRRLKACQKLRWKTVPVRIVDLEEIIEGEFAENACRKDFTLSEIAAIAKKLRPIIEAKARERKLAGLMQNSTVGKSLHHGGKSRDLIGRYLGLSGITLEKIEDIVQAAEENPEKYGQFKEGMDQRGKVNKFWQQLRMAKLMDEAKRHHNQNGRKTDDQNILIGDMGLLWERLENGSVDLFFTDPPFMDIAAYGRLAELAAAKLKPSGLCLAYAGQLFLPEVLTQMARHLDYWWILVVRFDGLCRFHARKIQNRWRPIVAFAKPPVKAAPDWLCDCIDGSGRDKTYHEWSQGEREAAYLIQRLTHPGAICVDAFCGGGTIPAACKATGRRWLATERNRATAMVARRRLAQMKG